MVLVERIAGSPTDGTDEYLSGGHHLANYPIVKDELEQTVTVLDQFRAGDARPITFTAARASRHAKGQSTSGGST